MLFTIMVLKGHKGRAERSLKGLDFFCQQHSFFRFLSMKERENAKECPGIIFQGHLFGGQFVCKSGQNCQNALSFLLH